MKERPLPPSIQNAKRRWLPRKLNGQFWSVGFSVFFGIFGYLVCGVFVIHMLKLMVSC